MKPIFLKRTKATLPNSDVSKRQIGQGLDGKAHGACFLHTTDQSRYCKCWRVAAHFVFKTRSRVFATGFAQDACQRFNVRFQQIFRLKRRKTLLGNRVISGGGLRPYSSEINIQKTSSQYVGISGSKRFCVARYGTQIVTNYFRIK